MSGSELIELCVSITSHDIILPSPYEGSLEPERYNVDFLLH